MNENRIMELITSEYSWEQIIYKIIAWEGLDPWDLDLTALSRSFLQYISKLKVLDFKIPAKYIIIASVLLRMKSDHLHFIEDFIADDHFQDQMESEIEGTVIRQEEGKFEVNPITVPPKRYARRKIMVTELIDALRKALTTEEKRKLRGIKARKQIKVKEDNIAIRINKLYERINELMKKIRNEELKFSDLVNKWKRDNIVNTFLPLIYLDNENKVRCRQEEVFDEIYIKRG